MPIIFPVILIVISIVVIGIIVGRKFPQLGNLDIDNLPQEKEARKKQELIQRRVVAESGALAEKLKKVFAPVRWVWGQLQLKFRIYVGKIERFWHHEQREKKEQQAPTVATSPEDLNDRLTALLQRGTQNFEQNYYDKAEEFFIAAIKLDPKYALAYRGLADTYLAQGSLTEAKETYQYLLQLQPKDDNTLAKVAELFEKEGKLEEAVTYLQQAVIINDSLSSRFFYLADLLMRLGQPEVAREAIAQAVELEPKNPKYLDLLIETGILCGDKDLALRGFNELRLVNPENKKLDSFQTRVNSL
jgi:tetratricopeptide (TPR) repeat protein